MLVEHVVCLLESFKPPQQALMWHEADKGVKSV